MLIVIRTNVRTTINRWYRAVLIRDDTAMYLINDYRYRFLNNHNDKRIELWKIVVTDGRICLLDYIIIIKLFVNISYDN